MDDMITAKRGKVTRAAAVCSSCSVANFMQPTILEAQIVSWISIAGSVVIFIVGVILSLITGSSVALATAIDAGLDIVASSLVLWRFWGTEGKDEMRLSYREKRADVLISFSFLMLGTVVAIDAIVHLSEGDKVSNEDILIGYNVILTFFFLALGSYKMYVGRCLNSHSMKSDAWNSLLGGVTTLGVVIDGALMKADSDIWYLDSIFGILIAVLLVIIGTRTLHKYHWWDRGFWYPDIPMEPIDGFGIKKAEPEMSLEMI